MSKPLGTVEAAAEHAKAFDSKPTIITEAQLEKLGALVDRLDNVVHAGALPISDKLRVTALSEVLPDLRSQLRALYVEIAGDDPWDWTDEPDETEPANGR